MEQEGSQVDKNLSLISPEKILFPNETIHDGKYFHVGQDFEVPIPGFFIIAAKRDRVRSFDDFTDEEISEFASILKTVRTTMRKALGVENAYFFQNEDTAHGFHFWCYPVHDWAVEKFGRKIQAVRPAMRYAIENMKDDASIAAVKDAAQKARYYLANK